MPSFANIDRDTIIGAAAAAYKCGEVDENPEIVVRNIIWSINRTLSWYRSGHHVSLLLDTGEVSGLRIKANCRITIPLIVRGNAVIFAGKTFDVVSSGGASALADAILSKIEAAPEAEQ